jgi:putative ABC transport system permease protein
MITIFKILLESTTQAFQQLWGNKLRTFLSLLGITIGIWCVIMVLSAVDSMEASIRQSFQKLGDDVIYIDKFSWEEDPSANYWKWMRRPNPSFNDFKALKKNLNSAQAVTYSSFIGPKNIEYRSSSIEGAFTIAVTESYAKMFNLEFEKGRFYTDTEYRLGGPQILLGFKVAEELFGELDPIGKKVKFLGQKCYVIGVMEEGGKDIINPLNFDNAVVISYELARKITDVNNNSRRGGSVNVKAREGVSLDELKDDIIGVMRASRKIKPKSENNFALNTLSIISNALDSVFGILRLVGFVIGAFSMIVGMFSVANIMFVSVKERTNIIGIKKALGARRRVILLEFLTESIILCLIGGAMGLTLVWAMSYVVTQAFGFEVFLSMKNLTIGIIASTATGVISGIIPAIIAAAMDPVDAIRQ